MTTTITEGAATCTSAEAVIRDALSRGDSKRALNAALGALQAELADLRRPRRGRPADGAHLDAELAGTLLAIAVQAHRHERPRDFPGRPGGHHLLATFQAALDATSSPGEGA